MGWLVAIGMFIVGVILGAVIKKKRLLILSLLLLTLPAAWINFSLWDGKGPSDGLAALYFLGALALIPIAMLYIGALIGALIESILTKNTKEKNQGVPEVEED